MENFQENFNRIQGKIQQLLKHLAAQDKENEQCKKELARLRQQKEEHETQIKELRQQNYILKAATSSMNETDKAALEQAINKYVRDIDKCIALLSE